MWIKLWSWCLSFLYVLILYAYGFKASNNIREFFDEVSLVIFKPTHYLFDVHWSVLLIMVFVGTLSLIYKDWICSKHVAIVINWIVTIVIIIIPIIYASIFLNLHLPP